MNPLDYAINREIDIRMARHFARSNARSLTWRIVIGGPDFIFVPDSRYFFRRKTNTFLVFAGACPFFFAPFSPTPPHAPFLAPLLPSAPPVNYGTPCDAEGFQSCARKDRLRYGRLRPENGRRLWETSADDRTVVRLLTSKKGALGKRTRVGVTLKYILVPC